MTYYFCLGANGAGHNCFGLVGLCCVYRYCGVGSTLVCASVKSAAYDGLQRDDPGFKGERGQSGGQADARSRPSVDPARSRFPPCAVGESSGDGLVIATA